MRLDQTIVLGQINKIMEFVQLLKYSSYLLWNVRIKALGVYIRTYLNEHNLYICMTLDIVSVTFPDCVSDADSYGGVSDYDIIGNICLAIKDVLS